MGFLKQATDPKQEEDTYYLQQELLPNSILFKVIMSDKPA